MKLAFAFVAMAGAMLFGACGELSASKPSRRGGSGSATLSAPAEPTPRVRITTPARGSFMIPGRIAVEGTVEPVGAPIVEVLLDGQPVALDANNVFRGFADAKEGLTVIQATATDAAGKRGGTSIGVLAGTFKPLSQPIANAGCARLNDMAIDALGKIAEGALYHTDFNALFQSLGWFRATQILWVTLDIKITQVRYRSIGVTGDARPGVLAGTIAVDNPIFDVEVATDWGVGAPSITVATLEADQAVVNASISATAAQGALTLGIPSATISFQNFRVAAAGGLLSVVANVLPGVVESLIRDWALDALKNDAPPFISEELAKVLTPNPPYDVYGKPFAHAVRPRQVQIDGAGASVWLDFDAVTGPLTPRGQSAPGSFSTAGTLPVPFTPRGFMGSIDDDALNRALHVAWAGGVLDLRLDAAFVAQTGIPIPFQLEAGAIRRFIPEIGGRIPDDAPIVLALEPALPPIVEVTGYPDIVTMRLGEFAFDVLVDRGSGLERLVRCVVQAQFGVTLGFSATGLLVKSVSNPRIHVDVADEPILELDDRRLEAFMTIILTPAIPYMLNSVPVLNVPHLNQLSLVNVNVFEDSAGIGIEGDLTR